MRYASVIVDIPTRALARAYDYAIPAALEGECVTGATVLVTFSGRAAVAYVTDVSDQPPEGVDPSRIREVERVLAPSAFDKSQAQLALWMAREYAAPLADCVRLLVAPGQSVRVRREGDSGPWQLVCDRTDAVDDRWASLGEAAEGFVPAANASRQRQVLEALSSGPVRMAELSLLVPGAGAAVRALQKRGVVAIEHRRRVRGGESTALSSASAARPHSLTDGQREALAAIGAVASSGEGGVVLVDGVTGSGKTEVYLQAIECALEHGQGAIVLVPEISLTAQTVGRFRSRFGDKVAVLHSRLSAGERYDQWDMVRSGDARVVVGARSALFAPVRDLGLIVIDEEHEHTYKQDSSPRYHARDVAARMALVGRVPLVLGSATPSMEMLSAADEGTWRGLPVSAVRMRERPGGAQLPSVEVIDMRVHRERAGLTSLSMPLQRALVDCVQSGHKAVLLHNRRGFANFLMCRDCGCVPTCPHCSTSLTYHERGHSLKCHTCGSSWPVRAYPDPGTACPNCGSRYLGAYGIGTQQVEDELRQLLGDDVTIVRMDADSTRAKGAHQRLLEEFDAAERAVLIGTQMIAKGLDFPEVTLVGVVNADTALKMPDFRAAERTFDLLEQVAGRAGRGEDPGRVLIQTYWASHPAIHAVASRNRDAFVRKELAERRDLSYPPYARLGNVLVWGRNVGAVERTVGAVAQELFQSVGLDPAWRVIGPSECVISRVKDRVRHHVLVKGPADANMGEALARAVEAAAPPRGVSVAIDVDAADML